MSLSKGTRGLKFMQRAAAIQGKPVEADEPRKLILGEEDAQWVLPRAAVPSIISAPSSKSKGKAPVRVSYVQSYFPFLGGDEEEEEPSHQAGPSRGARLQFGKPDPEPVSDTAKQEEGEGEQEEGVSDDQDEQPIRAKASSHATPKQNGTQSPRPRHTNSKGFVRPGGFEDMPAPSPPGANTSKRKERGADEDPEVDEMIAGARKKRDKRGKKSKGKLAKASVYTEVSDAESESQAFLDRLMDEFKEE